jgi:hypothetical protein
MTPPDNSVPAGYTGFAQLEPTLPSYHYYDAAHYERELRTAACGQDPSPGLWTGRHAVLSSLA